MSAARPRTDPETFLPLTELWLNILLALSAGSRHGYAIIREIEDRTEGRVHPATGTMYLALQRLEQDGLIEEAKGPAAKKPDRRRRRFYKLTRFGRLVMAAEVERLARQLAIAVDKNVIDAARLRSL